VDAGDGNDTLVGPVVNSTWIINAHNQGTVGNVAFSSVENLTGSDGADVFVFDNSAGAITGRVNGGNGVNVLEYSRYPAGVSVHLANNPTPGTATGTSGVLNIQTIYGSRYNDVLIGNDQDNTFLTYGGRDVVRAAGGNDTIHVVGVQDPASTIDGGAGSNLLWPDNVGANTWTLTGAGAGTVSSTGFVNGGPLAFTNMQRLLGGRYADTFRVRAGASFSYLSGYGGPNWLDYSAYPSAVSVNLARHTATGVGGANLFLIQNVFGSTTARNTLTGDTSNILVGGNAADTITGGSGRSILIGGRGADAIAGGTADDIVIGGFTDYDRNQAALETIMQEWSSTSDSYLVRISKIRAGFGWRTRYRLVWGSGPGTTVHDDAAADTLRGDPAGSIRRGLDWFFANQAPGTRDAILDLQSGEKVNNQA
jgi:Ca2+-binding RTX toxin-like protein